MKRFRFRLEPVVRYRQYLERIAQLDLARERQAFVKTKERISAIEETIRQAAGELEAEEDHGVDVERCRLFLVYLRGLNHDIEAENRRLGEIGRRIREKQDIVKGKSIKRKTMELLKKHEYFKYLEWVGIAEQKMADELIALRKDEIHD